MFSWPNLISIHKYIAVMKHYCNKLEKFVKSGFNKWKKKHTESSVHGQCSQMYVSYRQSLTVGDVHQ